MAAGAFPDYAAASRAARGWWLADIKHQSARKRADLRQTTDHACRSRLQQKNARIDDLVLA